MQPITKKRVDNIELGENENVIALFSLLKISLITILLIFVVIGNLLSDNPELLKTSMQQAILSLVTIAYMLVIITAIVLKYRFFPIVKFFITVLFIDLAITVVLVHLTGGAGSPYSILFLVPVMASAIILSPRWAVAFTLISLTLYFLISILGWGGVISPIEGQLLLPNALTAQGLARRLSLNTSAFATVAALSITLSRNLIKSKKVVRSQDKELSALKFRHQDILKSLNDGVVTLDSNGKILTCSETAEKILFEDESIPNHINEWGFEFKEMFLSKQTLKRVILSTDKGEIHLELSLMELKSKLVSHRGYVLIIRDQTEEAELEEEVAKQQRLAALGRLSAGIAHEIRNPLASISGSLELLKRGIGKDLKGDDLVLFDIVSHEIKRVNDLISELLLYTRDKPLNLIKIDLVAFLLESVTLVKKDPRSKDIDIQLNLPKLAQIEVDPDGIRQIFLNLIFNAMEMKETTQVSISLKDKSSRWIISIEDNGPGIPEHECEKIFEPFFTTKERGTGLGLAIADKIVRRHGGNLSVTCPNSGGSIFSISLSQHRISSGEFRT
jgi:two-component system, NtrC family, sensor histidine kinase PilS